jgi:DNA-directed RNA polymerase II subunit RPB1
MQEDADMLESHYELADEPTKDMSPWVLRLMLDTAALDGKEMHLSEVVARIKEKYHTGSEEFEIISSDDNADNLVIRIRLLRRTNASVEEDEDEEETEDHWLRSIAMDMLHTLKLRGIPDIPRVLIEQVCVCVRVRMCVL